MRGAHAASAHVGVRVHPESKRQSGHELAAPEKEQPWYCPLIALRRLNRGLHHLSHRFFVGDLPAAPPPLPIGSPNSTQAYAFSKSNGNLLDIGLFGVMLATRDIGGPIEVATRAALQEAAEEMGLF